MGRHKVSKVRVPPLCVWNLRNLGDNQGLQQSLGGPFFELETHWGQLPLTNKIS